MMRCLLAVVVLLLMAILPSFAAPKGPLTAGTAPGSLNGRPASVQYTPGVHYPFKWSVLATEPVGAPPPPNNYTAPYEEWPDPARVTGHRSAMSPEIWIIGSSQKLDADVKRKSHILIGYPKPKGGLVPAPQ